MEQPDGYIPSDNVSKLNIRRIITMLPGVIVIAAGVNPMKALLMSQVCLSFVLPVAIISMLIITGRKDLMGDFVNKPYVKFLGWLIAIMIISLNIVLLYITFTGSV